MYKFILIVIFCTLIFYYFYTLLNKYTVEKYGEPIHVNTWEPIHVNTGEPIHVNTEEYKKRMESNDKKNLYRIGLSNGIPIETENCYDTCNKTDCIKMDDKATTLKKCLECNRQKNKCFKPDILGGSCNDCAPNTKKINCYELQYFGCTDPKNFDSTRGVAPYFIKIPDNSITSPYNKKCVFCWDILDNI